MMKAGLLDEIIEIYKSEIVVNEYGEREEQFIKKCSTRAYVSWSGGNRSITNDEIFHTYTKTFTVRSYIPVVETDIIKWQNNNYRIITIEHRKGYNGIIIIAELINE